MAISSSCQFCFVMALNTGRPKKQVAWGVTAAARGAYAGCRGPD